MSNCESFSTTLNQGRRKAGDITERPQSKTKRVENLRNHSANLGKMTSLYKSSSTQDFATRVTDRTHDQAESAAAAKQKFMQEKQLEKKVLTALAVKLKAQINQVQKQTRQITNTTVLAKDEMRAMQRAHQGKDQKTEDAARLVKDTKRQVAELDQDCREL